MTSRNSSKSWTWHDDRQWASSRLRKNFGPMGPFSRTPDQMEWGLEVRSEYTQGSQRMGEITIRGTLDGLLTMRITEEPTA